MDVVQEEMTMLFGTRLVSALPMGMAVIGLMLGVAPSSAESGAHQIGAEDSWVESTPWYSQPPLQGTGPGHYYSYHPHHVPGYPVELRGYPVPIYSTTHPTKPPAARYRSASASHVAWCRDRWFTYRSFDNSYQPLHGQRRQCRSPYF